MQRFRLQILELPYFEVSSFNLRGPTTLLAVSTGFAPRFCVGPGRLQ